MIKHSVYGFLLTKRKSNIRDEGIFSLGSALQKLVNINCLELNLNYNFIGSCGAYIITSALANNTKIYSLGLSFIENKITDETLFALGTTLLECKYIYSLRLFLGDNRICQIGAYNLGLGLAKIPNLKILKLTLRDNQIVSKGIQDLVQALQQCSQLLNLELILWNGQILNTQEKIIKFSSQLAKCTEIQTLILNSGWKTLLGENIKLLVDDLPEFKNLNCLQFNLIQSHLHQLGAQALACYLKKQLKLTKLELILSGNEIQEIGASELFQAIGTIKTIQQLEISVGQNNIKNEGVVALNKTLCLLSNTLKVLTVQLDFNQKSDEGAIKLGKALSKCQNLTHLEIDLSENQISDIGISSLSLGFSNCSQIV
ncbi:hypothetical protein ABPG72_021191 [Tetrahymena utriculariae]